MKRKGILLMVLSLMIALTCAPAFAQNATGKVVGVVRDPQGAVVPDAKITVTSVETGVAHRVTSGHDGAYQVINLPIGKYCVTGEHEGFQKVVTTPYSLEINATLKVDLTLTIGGANEVVEVSGTAAAVETQNATVGNSVTSRPIVDLPLNGRNVLDLAKLQAGVVESNTAGQFSIAGGRGDSVSFLLDGGNNNNLVDNSVVFNPNPDTIAEFKILESNYNAEYGRNAGGIISVVSKSGTNVLHGSAWDFARNDAFNAKDYFTKEVGILKRHQFGATLGGPVVLPHFNGKDKAFFFLSYQGQRQTETVYPEYGSYKAFTPEELKGDFSKSDDRDYVAAFLASNPYYQSDPAKAAQGIIDPSKIDPIAQRYIKAGIIPSSSTGYVAPQAKQKSDNDEFTGKFDYNFSPSDRLNATLGFKRAPGNRPFAGGASMPFYVNDNGHTYFLNTAYTKSFSANVLNELRVTAQRYNNQEGYPATKLPSGPEMGIQITPDLLAGPPIIGFTDDDSYLGFTYRGPVDKISNTFGFSDTLTWVKGRHTLKYGFNFSPYQTNMLYGYLVNGEFDFYGGKYSTTGSPFADFLIGAPEEYLQSANSASNIRSKSYAAFAQDDWRVTNTLTLSFGLRYEYSTPKKDTQGRTFSFIPGLQSTVFPGAPLGLVFPGDKGAPDGANFADRNDFAPRFGFAWDPTGKGKMSIRGGFGVFYDILKAEDNLQFNGQPPFNGGAHIYFDPWASAGASPYFVDPFGSTGTVNTFPSHAPNRNIDFSAFLPLGENSMYFVDPNLRTPYVYQYNLTVQRDLGHSLTAEVAYVGSTAHKLTVLVDNNPMVPGSTVRIHNQQFSGQDPETYSYMDTFKNLGYQNYNSLQTTLKKATTGAGSRLGATYFSLAYTLSKNIDNASGYRAGSNRVTYFNPGIDRAVSDQDVTHRIVFSGGWDLPFAQLWANGPKRLTQGWNLNPIVSWRSGFPLDVRGVLKRYLDEPGPSGVGDANLVRPNLNGSTVTTLDPKKNVTDAGALYVSWENNFNTNYPADQYTYGTLPRNFFRGPGRFNVDMTVGKTTKLTERTALELRLDGFNLFNSVQFDNPNVNPRSSSFGRIATAASPRILQIGAKVTF